MPFNACYHAIFYCDICFKNIECFGQNFADSKKEAQELGWKISSFQSDIALCPEHIKATKEEIAEANRQRDQIDEEFSAALNGDNDATSK